MRAGSALNTLFSGYIIDQAISLIKATGHVVWVSQYRARNTPKTAGHRNKPLTS
jgi:hypothetical protein